MPHDELPVARPTWRGRAAKLIRYIAVSLIGTATTVILLAVLVGAIDFSATWSNLLAAGCATALSFELDRRWVWRKRGRASWSRETLPFWIWSLSELGLSTLAVHLVAAHARSAGWNHTTRTVSVEIASVGMSLATWVLQFLLFDRVLFRDRRLSLAQARPPLGQARPPLGGRPCEQQLSN